MHLAYNVLRTLIQESTTVHQQAMSQTKGWKSQAVA